MAGTLTLSTLSDGTNSTSATNAIQGSAKAWVNYNGVAQTVRASYNVSSVTYVAAGNYTINFTNAMVDANFVTNLTHGYSGTGDDWVLDFIESSNSSNKTASKTRVQFLNIGGSALVNVSDVMVSIFR
jgi:hypothetical protein